MLSRVAGLFSRRGFNIVSLAVSPTEDERFSRMTIVVDADSSPVEQIVKQLNKLIPVIKITELASEQGVERELMLVTVRAQRGIASQVTELTAIFEAKIVDVGFEAMTIMVAGSPTGSTRSPISSGRSASSSCSAPGGSRCPASPASRSSCRAVAVARA